MSDRQNVKEVLFRQARRHTADCLRLAKENSELNEFRAARSRMLAVMEVIELCGLGEEYREWKEEKDDDASQDC